jgi:hypothetical protein
MLSPFGDRNFIEFAYLSFKQRTKAFLNTITSNLLNRSERPKRLTLCWKLFITVLYHLRRRT